MAGQAVSGLVTLWLDLLSAPDFDAYRHVSEGVPYTVEIGPHGGIHYTIG